MMFPIGTRFSIISQIIEHFLCSKIKSMCLPHNFIFAEKSNSKLTEVKLLQP